MPLEEAMPLALARQDFRDRTWYGEACCTVADVTLGLTLYTMWATRTGRQLRPVPLAQLMPQELIDFWADDQWEKASCPDTGSYGAISSPPTGLRLEHRALRPADPQPVNGISFSRVPVPIVHTTLAAVDIIGFCSRRLVADAQIHVRERMYEGLIEAFAMTGLPWRNCHLEDRGDGVLIVAPPEVDANYFLDPLAHHLHAVLRRSNRLVGDDAQLRLRLAVHHGRVLYDACGITGHAVCHLFRLLEAPAFKRAVDSTNADLGVVVSDQLYQDAAQCGGLFNPAAYQKLRIACKETRARAWLWLPTG